jgi:predicted ATPase
VDSLVEASPQILVTTHSPMILNYLEDEIAIAGVI